MTSTGQHPAVILFNPSTWRGVGDTTAPWGLLSLQSVLERGGFEVHLVDQRFDGQWREVVVRLLARGNVVMAGATAMTGIQLRGVLAFFKLVRSESCVPTVLGGMHASILPFETVAHEAVDYVAVGDGEQLVVGLAGCLANGSRPEAPGGAQAGFTESLVWPGKEQYSYGLVKDLEAVAWPDVSPDLMKRYVGTSPYGPMLSIVTSRGCPHGCAFCIYSNDRIKRGWTATSASSVVERMESLSVALGVEHFHIQDDNFFVSTSRVREFAELLLERGFSQTFTIGGAHVMHLLKFEEEFFVRLRKAGCVRLLIGAESGSQRILELVGKKQTSAEVEQVNSVLTRAGIRPIYSFISGVPGETDDDLRQTVQLMARLRASGARVDVGTIKPLIFFPGTRLYQWALDNGFDPPRTVEGWTGMSWDNYMELPYPWLSAVRKRFLLQLYYSSLLWNPSYHWVSSRLFTAGARALMPVTDYRMRNLDFRGAVMPRLLKWIQHRTLMPNN